MQGAFPEAEDAPAEAELAADAVFAGLVGGELLSHSERLSDGNLQCVGHACQTQPPTKMG